MYCNVESPLSAVEIDFFVYAAMKMNRSHLMFESLESRQLLASGLTAQYFDNKDFTSLKLSRVDAQVNFNWGTTSPASSMG